MWGENPPTFMGGAGGGKLNLQARFLRSQSHTALNPCNSITDDKKPSFTGSSLA